MNQNTWLEVSLTVDGELAEAVAEVLARFAPGGVVIESTAVSQSPDGQKNKAEGLMRVAAYLPAREGIDEPRSKVEEALWYLGRIKTLPQPDFRTVEEADWASAWKEHYQPIRVGERLVIVPAWLNPEVEDRVPILIDPGMAFGTGTHPTTQLCLQYVEQILGDQPGADSRGGIDVIDIGCGSGILSIATHRLGAKNVLALDVDPQAVEISLANFRLNGLAESIEIGQGSLEEVLNGAFSFKRADLVLANILAPVLIKMLDSGLAGLLNPTGSLVLSGIIEDQLPEIAAAVERNALRLIDKKQIDDWVALHARK